MFRNLRLYRLPNGISSSPASLADQLATGAFRVCGASEARSAGWTDPHHDTGLVFALEKQLLLTYMSEDKILPSSYVARCVEAKAEELEEQQGFKPGRKQRMEIKESVIASLIPRAFTKLTRTSVWIDNKNGWLAIEGSESRCEEVIAHLRNSLTMIPEIALPRTVSAPAVCMAQWLTDGDAPEPFTIDRDCELMAHTEDPGTVRYTRQPLDTADVRNHIDSGKFPTRMAMTSEDRISFVLTDNMEIKRISILDVLKEHASAEAKDAEELFASNFALYTGELSRLIAHVVEACGGEQPGTEE